MEVVEGEVAATRKLTDEGVKLLRKEEEWNKEVEAKAFHLAGERNVVETNKKKADEEVEQLRQEL